MSNRITILVASLLAVIAFAAGIVAMTSEGGPLVCTTDARIDAPEGWMWQRDGANDCAWTLYDGEGNAAPDSVYEDAGELPPPPNTDLTAPVAFAVGAIAAVVAGVAASRSRNPAARSSRSD